MISNAIKISILPSSFFNLQAGMLAANFKLPAKNIVISIGPVGVPWQQTILGLDRCPSKSRKPTAYPDV